MPQQVLGSGGKSWSRFGAYPNSAADDAYLSKSASMSVRTQEILTAGSYAGDMSNFKSLSYLDGKDGDGGRAQYDKTAMHHGVAEIKSRISAALLSGAVIVGIEHCTGCSRGSHDHKNEDYEEAFNSLGFYLEDNVTRIRAKMAQSGRQEQIIPPVKVVGNCDGAPRLNAFEVYYWFNNRKILIFSKLKSGKLPKNEVILAALKFALRRDGTGSKAEMPPKDSFASPIPLWPHAHLFPYNCLYDKGSTVEVPKHEANVDRGKQVDKGGQKKEKRLHPGSSIPKTHLMESDKIASPGSFFPDISKRSSSSSKSRKTATSPTVTSSGSPVRLGSSGSDGTNYEEAVVSPPPYRSHKDQSGGHEESPSIRKNLRRSSYLGGVLAAVKTDGRELQDARLLKSDIYTSEEVELVSRTTSSETLKLRKVIHSEDDNGKSLHSRHSERPWRTTDMRGKGSRSPRSTASTPSAAASRGHITPPTPSTEIDARSGSGGEQGKTQTLVVHEALARRIEEATAQYTSSSDSESSGNNVGTRKRKKNERGARSAVSEPGSRSQSVGRASSRRSRKKSQSSTEKELRGMKASAESSRNSTSRKKQPVKSPREPVYVMEGSSKPAPSDRNNKRTNRWLVDLVEKNFRSSEEARTNRYAKEVNAVKQHMEDKSINLSHLPHKPVNQASIGTMLRESLLKAQEQKEADEKGKERELEARRAAEKAVKAKSEQRKLASSTRAAISNLAPASVSVPVTQRESENTEERSRRRGGGYGGGVKSNPVTSRLPTSAQSDRREGSVEESEPIQNSIESSSSGSETEKDDTEEVECNTGGDGLAETEGGKESLTKDRPSGELEENPEDDTGDGQAEDAKEIVEADVEGRSGTAPTRTEAEPRPNNEPGASVRNSFTSPRKSARGKKLSARGAPTTPKTPRVVVDNLAIGPSPRGSRENRETILPNGHVERQPSPEPVPEPEPVVDWNRSDTAMCIRLGCRKWVVMENDVITSTHMCQRGNDSKSDSGEKDADVSDTDSEQEEDSTPIEVAPEDGEGVKIQAPDQAPNASPSPPSRLSMAPSPAPTLAIPVRTPRDVCRYHPGIFDFAHPNGWWKDHWTCCGKEWTAPGCTKGEHKVKTAESVSQLCKNCGRWFMQCENTEDSCGGHGRHTGYADWPHPNGKNRFVKNGVQGRSRDPKKAKPMDPELVSFLQWCLPKMGLRWGAFERQNQFNDRPQFIMWKKRLSTRCEQLKLKGPQGYRQYLEKNFPKCNLKTADENNEWRVLEKMFRFDISHFYRDREVYDDIAQNHFKRMCELANATSGESDETPEGESKAVRVWCAGCASGEEPYTLKVLWNDIVQKNPLEIMATDVNASSIARATKGRYRFLPPNLPQSFIDKTFICGGRGRAYSIRNELREGIDFQVQDIRHHTPDGPLHMIFSRRCLFLYFDIVVQKIVLQKMLERLVVGGLLIVGYREKLPCQVKGLVEVRPCLWMKTEECVPPYVSLTAEEMEKALEGEDEEEEEVAENNESMKSEDPGIENESFSRSASTCEMVSNEPEWFELQKKPEVEQEEVELKDPKEEQGRQSVRSNTSSSEKSVGVNDENAGSRGSSYPASDIQESESESEESDIENEVWGRASIRERRQDFSKTKYKIKESLDWFANNGLF